MNLRGLVLCLVLGGMPGLATADEARDLPPPGKIRDLDYGDVLFHFFQDDYFESLVRLEVSREFERLPNHAAEADLLSGGLYLSLGLHHEAQRIFDRLLAGPVPPSVSDRAHFYLARIGYQRGYYAEAARSLARIQGALPGKLESERLLLAANVLMAEGRYAAAAATLAAPREDRWLPYARYNLGVALVRSGQAAEGRRWLEAVGTMGVRDEEQRALRDRANLALGYALLQEGQGDPAVAALGRVRLEGPYSNRALLGLGWAQSEAGRPAQALAPWLELREGRLLDSAVQESLLAVPYAYARLASNGQAAAQYRHAVDAYAAEAGRIDESIAAIRAGGFLDAIIEAAPREGEPGWFWQLAEAPDAPHTRYLYHLLASHTFQEGLKNYRDLRLMQRNLARSRDSLEAFRDMVAGREQAVAARAPRGVQALSTTDLEAYALRYEAVERRLEAIVAARDVPALATTAEADQWAALERATGRLEAMPPGAQREALAERVRLLRGTLLWQLDADYKLRLHRLEVALDETGASLEEARRRLEGVAAAGALAPRDTSGFAARVDDMGRRIDELEPRLEAMAAAQEGLLARLAVRELEAQQRRLANYAMQAQFALASLYDGATAGRSP